ncbi:MAG TPA: glycoside hydrolase family 16 protein [Blastocatellia bacterium]|nr:glycoside hydrolase family 16 protein [Blastocatellia bacterium]
MIKRLVRITGAVAAVLVASAAIGRAQTSPNLSLVWSDEFNGPANSAPDPAKWTFDIGGNGWGNNELESYTNRLNNAFIDGQGNLVIKTMKESFTGTDGIARDYTSARMLTKGLFSQRFGRFEARIKIPFGQGIWPAFWMLGANIDTVSWPACGEVDIMENIGSEPSINHGSLHGPGYSGGASLTGSFTLPTGQRLSDDYHIFALDWSPNLVQFSVDGNVYETRTPADVPPGGTWIYDHPFFILMNVAVGGNFPGSPDSTTVFPQTMLVDYVRVYADTTLTSSPVLITSALISGNNIVINGEKFARGAVILIGGQPGNTKFISSTVLLGKKLAKRMPRHVPIPIQVSEPGGQMSNTVMVTRP